MSKIDICRRLCELGEERSPNTLRKLPLAKLQSLLAEYEYAAKVRAESIDLGAQPAIEKAAEYVQMAQMPATAVLPVCAPEPACIPAPIPVATVAPVQQRRPMTWRDLVAAPFRLCLGLLGM